MKVNWITYSFLSSMASLSFSCFFFTSAAAEVLSYIVSKVAIVLLELQNLWDAIANPFFKASPANPENLLSFTSTFGIRSLCVNSHMYTARVTAIQRSSPAIQSFVS